MQLAGKTWIARHGETVFNAARRLQGDHLHTPLSRAGFAQADRMGAALKAQMGARPALTLWASPTGRALQTLAIVAEHLELDWHAARTDERLAEIGMGSWGGRYYADVEAEFGPVVDRDKALLIPAPDGEAYPAIAARVTEWAREAAGDVNDRLVVMHGISSRVLRGVLTGRADDAVWGAPIAPGLPQGAVVLIEDGQETAVVAGSGGQHA